MAAGKAIVIGTTGFEPGQVATIREAARAIPVVFAPNFAIGVLVTMKLVDMASRALGPDYDVEVFELHHKLKVDAPSGTALKLGEVAAAARGTSLAKDGVFARHGVTGERKAGTLGFSVARGGDVDRRPHGLLPRHGRAHRDHAPLRQPRHLRAGGHPRREVAPWPRSGPLRHGRRARASWLTVAVNLWNTDEHG